MADNYPYRETEKKWQERWEKQGLFKVKNSAVKDKYYVLEMFPYPSGYLHMGHVRVYCIGDVIAHYMRMKGKDVIHPMGYDAFGLPAENAAIKNKVPPAKWTYGNINHARGQFKKMGISYDWDREFATCDKEYYKWNQWFFIKMYEKGLAFRKNSSVNWCEECGTVLANEQVHEGKCWRCGCEVAQKDLAQWFFKTTAYSQELLDRHCGLDWAEKVKIMQENWIGRSTGVKINFELAGKEKEKIPVFTTRPDTIFGATYVVLAPEHPLVEKIKNKVDDNKKKEIENFREKVRKSDRTIEALLNTEKEGVDTSAKAINPVNGEEVPVFIANYVLMEYGTGAIMAVPTHDSRDFHFARKYKLPMRVVIQPDGGELSPEKMDDAYEGSGIMRNSGKFDGLQNEEGKEKAADWMQKEGMGEKTIQYKLKDWLISRQRYWGTPIPVLYCDKCGVVPEKEENLPVTLPEDIKFTGRGNPLETSKSFLNAKCPKCGGPAKRETDTMDTFVDSSWYFARYCDPKNTEKPIGGEGAKLLPVDQYVGGAEHSCMHLIYARFFTYVMRDMGLIKADEPFKKLLNQGMVIKDGNKMSKSKGNTVSPDDMIENYGADTARLFMLFAAPPQADLEWNDEGVAGANRFLNRVWRKITGIAEKIKKAEAKCEGLSGEKQELAGKVHRTIKKVTTDIEKEQQFNTAIAALMELYNSLSSVKPDTEKDANLLKFTAENMVLLMAPFVPHFAEELWEMLGNKESVFKASWPGYDEKMCKEEEIEFVVQINGKIRDKFSAVSGAKQEDIEERAMAGQKIKEHIKDKKIIKKIFIKNKLLNIVVK